MIVGNIIYTGLFNGGLYEKYHVFSDGKYLGKLDSVIHKGIMGSRNRLYNNAFIFDSQPELNHHSWWRADGTPYPKEQVPKGYLAMTLLLT